MFQLLKEHFEDPESETTKEILKSYYDMHEDFKAAKLQFKKDLIWFIHEYIKYDVDIEYMEEYILYLIEKFSPQDVVSEITQFDGTAYDKIYQIKTIRLFLDNSITDEDFIYENCTPNFYLLNKHLDKERLKKNDKMKKLFNDLESCIIILNEMIKIGHNIKKYAKYSFDVNKSFLEAAEVDFVKNLMILVSHGADIHVENDKAFELADKNNYVAIMKYLIGLDVNYYLSNEKTLAIINKNNLREYCDNLMQ